MFEILLPFLITCLIIEATPGPNMGYLAVLSATYGRRAGFAAVAGVALGLLIVGLAAALGLAAVISASPFLYQMLRWGGVAYMVYLAWESWRPDAGFNTPHNIDEDARHFKRGLITNILNPKAAVFYIAILPEFIHGAQNIAAQTVMLTVIYVAVATIIHAAIVAVSGAAQNFLEHEKRREMARKIFAVMLLGIAVWIAFKT